MGEASPRPSRSGRLGPPGVVSGGRYPSVSWAPSSVAGRRPEADLVSSTAGGCMALDRRRVRTAVVGQPVMPARPTGAAYGWAGAGTSSTPIAPATSLTGRIPSTPPPAPGRRPGSPARTTCTSSTGCWPGWRSRTSPPGPPSRARRTVPSAEKCSSPPLAAPACGSCSPSPPAHPHLRERTPQPQRPALLTALISTEAGTMHPIYRQLANHADHHLPQQASSPPRRSAQCRRAV